MATTAKLTTHLEFVRYVNKIAETLFSRLNLICNNFTLNYVKYTHPLCDESKQFLLNLNSDSPQIILELREHILMIWALCSDEMRKHLDPYLKVLILFSWDSNSETLDGQEYDEYTDKELDYSETVETDRAKRGTITPEIIAHVNSKGSL